MKKKDGFTLAEILITLGIVGVVAAMTVPRLMNNTSTSQIGPKLAKAAATFEQANQAMLNDNAVDTLSDGNLVSSDDAYWTSLSQYLKGSFVADDGSLKAFQTKDGVKYTVNIYTASNKKALRTHQSRVGHVHIDIDGGTDKSWGKDGFVFSFWEDGSLRPKGASDWEGGSTIDLNKFTGNGYTLDGSGLKNSAGSCVYAPGRDGYGKEEHWTTKCPSGSVVTGNNREYCTGSIFENDLKVLYQ